MCAVSIRDVAYEALTIASGQPFIPESPGREESGRVILCAAACFAAAGLERAYGTRAREAFESSVAHLGEKRLVFQAFARLGWSETSCADALKPNDAAPVSERLATMASLVRRIVNSDS